MNRLIREHGGIAARFFALVLAAALVSGCATIPESKIQAARTQLELRGLRGETEEVKGRLEAVEKVQEDLRTEIGRIREQGTAQKLVLFERKLTELEARLEALNAAREADKKEIIEKLSKAIADSVNAKLQRPDSRRGTRAPADGGEHTVAEGETLSGIAQKHGTTVEAIVEANGLRDRDIIRAGQRLVIPR